MTRGVLWLGGPRARKGDPYWVGADVLEGNL